KRTEDIQGLILTHGDPDHIGFAEKLRREYDVPVYIHMADAERATTGTKPKAPGGGFRLRPAAGFVTYALRKNGVRPKYLQKVEGVTDGDVPPLPGTPAVIGMPGHSAGSIAIHVPLAEAIFEGDALTTRHVLTGKTGVQPAPFTDDDEAAERSLERLATLEASWVLPGHGPPFQGTPAAAVTEYRMSRSVDPSPDLYLQLGRAASYSRQVGVSGILTHMRNQPHHGPQPNRSTVIPGGGAASGPR